MRFAFPEKSLCEAEVDSLFVSRVNEVAKR